MTDKEHKFENASISFEEVWKSLEEQDKTGVYKRAREMAGIAREQLEYAYNHGYETAKAKYAKPQGEWLDYSEEYGYIECPFCGQATTCEDNIDELHYCWNCGAYLQKGSEE